jgi:RHH-type proline utilization regulon transcriptional repressor/proline dehydrogenase/delta 1-pyrroline-5-carboxylate dehydrogenase
VRVEAGAPARELARVALAAARTGTVLEVSRAPGAPELAGVNARVEDAAAVAARLAAGQRVRVLVAPGAPVPAELAVAAGEVGASLLAAVPLADGRRELLTLLREQAVSRTVHRFGHLPAGR